MLPGHPKTLNLTTPATLSPEPSDSVVWVQACFELSPVGLLQAEKEKTCCAPSSNTNLCEKVRSHEIAESYRLVTEDPQSYN